MEVSHVSVKVGTVVEGSVASVKKFGAYVTLEGGEEGFIHISKVAREYVKNIEDYLKVGQKVEAKVLGTTKDGKWELSIKDLKSTSRRNWRNSCEIAARRFPPLREDSTRREVSVKDLKRLL